MHCLHVLVVEDNEINQMVILTYLEDMGHTAQLAASAEAALATLRHGRFDVILMDVNLPGQSGTAATRAIRAHADPLVASLPIIGISAHVQEADLAENRAAGMSVILPKPLAPEVLAAALRAEVPQVHVLRGLALDMGAARAVGLARMFLEGLTQGAASIQTAAAAKDFAVLSRAAHQLFGAAGNFDLPDLAAHLSRIEKLAELGASAALDRCLHQLPDLIADSRLALEAAVGFLDPAVNQAAQ